MGARRTASLSWGQRNIWLDHHQLPPRARHELNFSISYTPPPGSTVANLKLALDSMARRYESLRSTYGWEAGRGVVQRVDSPRPVPVRCHDTAERPEVSVTEVVAEVTEAEFRLDEQWPMRACVISTDSVPKLMVVVGHHIAVDDWSLEGMKREFAELHADLVAKRPVRLASVRHHPVDLAGYEASPAGVAASARALSYWDRTLAQVPTDQFTARRGPGQEPHSATLSSPAALAAAHDLATRHGVWPSLVHTAAFAAVLSAYTGSGGVAYRTYASNRDLPLHADMMSCLFLPVLVHTDCADDPAFDEVVRRTAKTCGEAMDHSYSAYDEALELVARHGFARGADLRLGTAVNYLKYPDKTRGGGRTVFNRNAVPTHWSLLGADCYLRISEWQDCAVTTLYAADTVISAADVEHFLRGMEAVLVRAAASEDAVRVSDIPALASFSPIPARAGADSPTLPALSSAAEQALIAAVSAANDLSTVDPTLPYVPAGGRVLHIPRTCDLLHADGWTPPSLHLLTGTHPLHAIAATMSRAEQLAAFT
ncbi:condensation domain-containing protein [Actinokineospora sp.]|uniref:condensation domain-containing protein n=1 Tax=Actinokineospora sp. TaxID=1872133 RepID=UPI004037D8C8